MWKVLLATMLIFPSGAYAAGERQCSAYSSKRVAHTLCLAYYGNKSRCSSMDEPVESWCEGIANLSTSHCTDRDLSEHDSNICRALVNDTYTRCSTGMDRSSDEDNGKEAFCVALVKRDASRCSRVGALAQECKMLVKARKDQSVGAPSKDVRPVPLATLHDIAAADKAVVEARSHIPDGAGNQEKEVEAFGGLGTARLIAARQMPAGSIVDLAVNAARMGGANCGEFGALTYAALLAEGINRPVLYGGLKDLDHSFTLIGDPREKGTPVVVDAWVSNPQGVTWADSCWNEREYGGFEVIETYNDSRPNPTYDLSGIQALDMDEATARRILGVPSGISLVDHIKADMKDHLWDQAFATGSDKPVTYVDDGRSRRR